MAGVDTAAALDDALTSIVSFFIVHTVRRAIKHVRENHHGAIVLVTGSHYLAGNALHILQNEPTLDLLV